MHHLVEPLDLDGILAMRSGPRVDNVVFEILCVKAQVENIVASLVCFDAVMALSDRSDEYLLGEAVSICNVLCRLL